MSMDGDRAEVNAVSIRYVGRGEPLKTGKIIATAKSKFIIPYF